MSNFTKAIDKIDKILETIDYSYVRVEVETKHEHYVLEKDKSKQIGFKAGGETE